MENQGKSLVR